MSIERWLKNLRNSLFPAIVVGCSSGVKFLNTIHSRTAVRSKRRTSLPPKGISCEQRGGVPSPLRREAADGFVTITTARQRVDNPRAPMRPNLLATNAGVEPTRGLPPKLVTRGRTAPLFARDTLKVSTNSWSTSGYRSSISSRDKGTLDSDVRGLGSDDTFKLARV